MQLAHDAFLEPHVHACHGFGDGQLPHRHLARPTAVLEAVMRHAERELEIGKRAVVGFRRRQDVRVLTVEFDIARTGIARSLRLANRLRSGVLGHDGFSVIAKQFWCGED
jgi:hypothetical protein